MLMTESDELQIQRYVDGELSVGDTRSLLERLDSVSGGWKLLACGLIEDRSFGKALRSQAASRMQPFHSSEIMNASTASPQSSKAKELARRWWSHPITSLTLCAAIAFVGGMLISGDSVFQSQDESVARHTTNIVRSENASPNKNRRFLVQMHPDESPVEIPVVSSLAELSHLRRDHPLFSQPAPNARKVRWVMLPVDDQRTLLVPVSEDAAPNLQ